MYIYSLLYDTQTMNEDKNKTTFILASESKNIPNLYLYTIPTCVMYIILFYNI